MLYYHSLIPKFLWWYKWVVSRCKIITDLIRTLIWKLTWNWFESGTETWSHDNARFGQIWTQCQVWVTHWPDLQPVPAVIHIYLYNIYTYLQIVNRNVYSPFLILRMWTGLFMLHEENRWAVGNNCKGLTIFWAKHIFVSKSCVKSFMWTVSLSAHPVYNLFNHKKQHFRQNEITYLFAEYLGNTEIFTLTSLR